MCSKENENDEHAAVSGINSSCKARQSTVICNMDFPPWVIRICSVSPCGLCVQWYIKWTASPPAWLRLWGKSSFVQEGPAEESRAMGRRLWRDVPPAGLRTELCTQWSLGIPPACTSAPPHHKALHSAGVNHAFPLPHRPAWEEPQVPMRTPRGPACQAG